MGMEENGHGRARKASLGTFFTLARAAGHGAAPFSVATVLMATKCPQASMDAGEQEPLTQQPIMGQELSTKEYFEHGRSS